MNLRCRQQDCTESKSLLTYQQYQFNTKEEIYCAFECLLLVSIFSYFFYRSFITIITFLFIYPFYRKYKKKKLMEQRKKELSFQCKEMLNSMMSSISAGFSLENAVVEAYIDMKELYGKNSLIAKELCLIRKGILNNQPVEQMFMNFGLRSQIEDIEELAGIIVIGKQYGGNLNELIKEAIWTIDEKISLEKEIYTMLQAKIYELKIMEIIPFLIIFYIDLTSPNYFTNLYDSFGGTFIMTSCLLIYLWAIRIANKILSIKI